MGKTKGPIEEAKQREESEPDLIGFLNALLCGPGQLWILASDRRHAKDATAQTAELKADWCRVQKRLGKSRDKAGNLMPGWITLDYA